MKWGCVFDDILVVCDYLLVMLECFGWVGIVGFCMGGQFVFVLLFRGFGVIVFFYGILLLCYFSEMLNGVCLIVVSFGICDLLGIGVVN